LRSDPGRVLDDPVETYQSASHPEMVKPEGVALRGCQVPFQPGSPWLFSLCCDSRFCEKAPKVSPYGGQSLTLCVNPQWVGPQVDWLQLHPLVDPQLMQR
jgi:hypothetical protein